MNKKRLILILLLAISTGIALFYGLDERLNITGNKFEFQNLTGKDLTNLQVEIINGQKQKIPLVVNGKQLKTTFPDWYGKDYAVIKWKDKKAKISFNEYKFTAWHKVDFQLTALPDKQGIKLIWELKTRDLQPVIDSLQ